jgi:hypothetical protein
LCEKKHSLGLGWGKGWVIDNVLVKSGSGPGGEVFLPIILKEN